MDWPSRRGRAVAWTATSLLGILSLGMPLTAGDYIEPRSESFIVGRSDTAAVAFGSVAYIYAGSTSNAPTSDAFRFDPKAKTLTPTTELLPSARRGASAAGNGTVAYLFGGEALEKYKNEVVRHDPAAGTFKGLTKKLPWAHAWSSAAWAGDSVYVFGGRGPLSTQSTYQADYISKDILRFDPRSETITTVGQLPIEVSASSAVFDGTHIYVFGGATYTAKRNTILQFDPLKNTVKVMDAKLPTPRDHTSAVWDGRYAYIFGGCVRASGGWDDCNISDVVRYDPVTDRVDVMVMKLGSGRGATSAVWLSPVAYVFGGRSGGELAEIVAYTPDVPKVNYPPVAHFTVGIREMKVSVDAAQSRDGDGSIASFEWDWGDETPAADGRVANHTYDREGEYTVLLSVADDEGLTGRYWTTVKIARLASNVDGDWSDDSGDAGDAGNDGASYGPADSPTEADAPSSSQDGSDPWTTFEGDGLPSDPADGSLPSDDDPVRAIRTNRPNLSGPPRDVPSAGVAIILVALVVLAASARRPD